MIEKPAADVSVVVANYNNGRYLSAFIESVINSSMWPRELIIVDDGSTDNSAGIIRSFAYLPFLKPVFFERNRGFTTALNTGVEMATGKYLLRADPDDLLHPGRISLQVSYMEKHPMVDVVGSNCIYFLDTLNRHLNNSNFPLTHGKIVKAYRNGEHGLLHATVCGRRDVFQQYRYQHLTPGEDYELFARMAKDGRQFANLVDSLYMVRVHPGSASSQISKDAIARTFGFRDEIFRTKTSKIRVWFYHRHILHYRCSMLAANSTKRYFHLAVSALCCPQKLLKRL